MAFWRWAEQQTRRRSRLQSSFWSRMQAHSLQELHFPWMVVGSAKRYQFWQQHSLSSRSPTVIQVMMSLLRSKGWSLYGYRGVICNLLPHRPTALYTMSTENLIRITVLANRNPNISEEEYHKHWTEKHAPLVSSWLQRHGVVKYTQVLYTSLPVASSKT